MKKRGFTLIELLGVIVILGVLVLVVFPPVLKQINNAKEGIGSATKALIIDASKDYYEDNKENYKKIDGVSYCINVNALIEKNYLNGKLKDENLDDIDKTRQVKMTYINNKFNYDVVDECVISLNRNGIEVAIEQEVLEDGLYESEIDEGRFIYRGGNPNNYLILPEAGVDTLYRIISFEDDGTIKVVRDESIGQMAWDTDVDLYYYDGTTLIASPRNNEQNTYCVYEREAGYAGCNAWGNQNNTYVDGILLKDIFYHKYYSDNSTTKLSQNAINKTVNQDSSLNIYLNNYWINNISLSNYIVNHSFDVGGPMYFSTYNGGYKYLKKEKNEESISLWNGKIGLMNITNFIETAINNGCNNVWQNYYFNNDNALVRENDNWPCKNNNWLFKNISEWTISTHSSGKYGVWRVDYKGFVSAGNDANYKLSIRPSFYLKTSTVLTGEGTSDSPYRVKQI